MFGAGETNVWDQPVTVDQLESEAGAAGALHGSLASGSLAATFTASQGLLLMIPNMYKVVGERLPAVFHVAARSLATHALSIFGDHSDVVATLPTGCAFLCSQSVQEAQDYALIAHLAAHKANYPFVHFYDGFRTSHEISKIELIDKADITSLVDLEALDMFRKTALSFEHPLQRGTAQNGDIFFTQVEAHNQHYANVLPSVLEAMEKVSKITGRTYTPFEYYGAADATEVVVTMGSSFHVVKATVEYLNRNGSKVGVVGVHLLRPFSAELLAQAIPTSVKVISVLDRCKENLANGEPLYRDVVEALTSVGRVEGVKIYHGRYGLSSKDFAPREAASVFTNMISASPKVEFTVGIIDDVTNLSLNIDKSFPSALPDGTISILSYGQGSDGTVGGGKQQIKILGNEPLHCSGYFAYDANKAGSTTISHLRFGPTVFEAPYYVSQADLVTVSQPSYLVRYASLFVRDIKVGGTLLINVPWETVEQLQAHMPPVLCQAIVDKKVNLFVMNAHRIAEKAGLPGRINMAMQAAIFKLMKVIPEATAIQLLKDSIMKTYGKKGMEIVESNWACVDMALDAIKKVEYPENFGKSTSYEERLRQSFIPDAPQFKQYRDHTRRSEFVEDIVDTTLAGIGDDIPTSVMTKYLGGLQEPGVADRTKRGISVQIPVWQSSTCIQCMSCTTVCPHSVIRGFVLDEQEEAKKPEGMDTIVFKDKKFQDQPHTFRIQIQPYSCTGCFRCIEACPTASKGTLKMATFDENANIEEERWEYLREDVTNKGDRVDIDTPAHVGLKDNLYEFSGACPGCSESAHLARLYQMFGKRMIIAGATGCESIISGYYANNAFTTNAKGQGPAWGNSLFEDFSEYGLGMALSVVYRRKAMKKAAEKLLASGTSAPEFLELVKAWYEAAQDLEQSEVCGDALKAYIAKHKMLGSVTPSVTDALYNFIKPEAQDLYTKPLVTIVAGDGASYDIGYGGLDHVLASGEEVHVFVFDTEVYSNTGGQKSKATPRSAVQQFASSGKNTAKKDIAQIFMTYGSIYVGSVALGANPTHCMKTFRESMEYPGPSIVLCMCPCIEWQIKGGLRKTTDIQKLAIETGMWFLFRYNPLNELEGKNPLTIDSKPPRKSPLDYLSTQNRFNTLTRANPERAEFLHTQLCRDSARRYQALLNRMNSWTPDQETALDKMVLEQFSLPKSVKIVKKATAPVAEEPKKEEPVVASYEPATHIIYASETGTAEGMANEISEFFGSKGVKIASVESCDSIKYDEIFRSGNTVIVTSATYGDGDVPMCAEEMCEYLKNAKLTGVMYMAVGVGSTDYDNFNGGIKKIDELLASAGAIKLADAAYCDINDDNSYNTVLDEWMPKAASSVTKTTEAPKSSAAPICQNQSPCCQQSNVACQKGACGIGANGSKTCSKISVIYASEMGNAECASETVEHALSEAGYQVVREDIADVNVEEKFNGRDTIVFVCSTAGDGEAPTSSLEAFDQLKEMKFTNRIAVFGLGSSSYEIFNGGAKLFVEAFEAAGANLFVAPVYGDDNDDEGYETKLAEFIPAVIKALQN